LIFWHSALKDESPSGPQRLTDRHQHHHPVIVRHEDLGDISRHRGNVNLERWNRSHIPMHPADTIRSRLRPSDLQRGGGRIEPDNVQTSLGKQASKAASSASDV
jgi:hypothetical protein